MTDEPKKPALPLVSAALDRFRTAREAVRGPQGPPPPPASEPVEAEPVEAQELPPFPAPRPGQTIALVSTDGLRVEPRPAPITRGATLTSWRPAKDGLQFEYSDGTLLWFRRSAGSRGAYQVLGGPTQLEAPRAPEGAPPTPRPNQVLETEDGGGLRVPADVTFTEGQTVPGGYAYRYAVPLGGEVVLRYDWSSRTWSDMSPRTKIGRVREG